MGRILFSSFFFVLIIWAMEPNFMGLTIFVANYNLPTYDLGI